MILYKKDSKGKIRQIEIFAEKDEVIRKTGLVGGNLITHISKTMGKNIGRSNETSPEEQAKLIAERKIKDKLSKGYFRTIEEAKNNKIINPMLAKVYEEEKHKIQWDTAYIQPKLDGMRCLAHIKDGNASLISREGKDIMGLYNSMGHIVKSLSAIKTNCVLDGELYCHGITFQENMKLIKKKREESIKISFCMYDTILNKPFNVRYSTLGLLPIMKHCKIVESYKLKKDSLELFNETFLRSGYEGSMIRHGIDGYKMGRADQLLKYKLFTDITAEIIDIIPSEKKPTWGKPILKIVEEQDDIKIGTIFSAGCKLSHEDREELLRNRLNYIGKTAEIRYFEKTDKGLPRFPVFYGVRLDK